MSVLTQSPHSASCTTLCPQEISLMPSQSEAHSDRQTDSQKSMAGFERMNRLSVAAKMKDSKQTRMNLVYISNLKENDSVLLFTLWSPSHCLDLRKAVLSHAQNYIVHPQLHSDFAV